MSGLTSFGYGIRLKSLARAAFKRQPEKWRAPSQHPAIFRADKRKPTLLEPRLISRQMPFFPLTTPYSIARDVDISLRRNNSGLVMCRLWGRCQWQVVCHPVSVLRMSGRTWSNTILWFLVGKTMILAMVTRIFGILAARLGCDRWKAENTTDFQRWDKGPINLQFWDPGSAGRACKWLGQYVGDSHDNRRLVVLAMPK
jgi:hypothetical protein